MRRDPSVIYLGEGTGERGGTFGNTLGLYQEFGAERMIDTPISELGFTGACIGAAYAVYQRLGQKLPSHAIGHSYLGTEHSDDSIESVALSLMRESHGLLEVMPRRSPLVRRRLRSADVHAAIHLP